MKSQLLQFDTRDDRREVCTLLAKLSPAERIAWLRWCCKQATLGGKRGMHPKIQRKTLELADQARRSDDADQRLTLDLYFDLWALSAQWKFEVATAVTELERRVRRKTSGFRGSDRWAAPS